MWRPMLCPPRLAAFLCCLVVSANSWSCTDMVDGGGSSSGTELKFQCSQDLTPGEARGDEFRCNDGSCIYVYGLCNHVCDCDDGSDEMQCDVPTPDTSDINGCWVSPDNPTGDAFSIDNNTLIVRGKVVATLIKVANNRFATSVQGRIKKEAAEVVHGTIHWGNQDVWIPAPFGACATSTTTTTQQLFRTTGAATTQQLRRTTTTTTQQLLKSTTTRKTTTTPTTTTTTTTTTRTTAPTRTASTTITTTITTTTTSKTTTKTTTKTTQQLLRTTTTTTAAATAQTTETTTKTTTTTITTTTTTTTAQQLFRTTSPTTENTTPPKTSTHTVTPEYRRTTTTTNTPLQTTGPHSSPRSTHRNTAATTTTTTTTTTTSTTTVLAATRTWVPPVLVYQGGSSGSLSWFVALLLVCCCLAWAAAAAGAAWTFFKPKKNRRMAQQHNYELNGMRRERLQSKVGDNLRTPLSGSLNMYPKQQYDLLTVSPEGSGVKLGVVPLAPPPAPLSSVMAMGPIRAPQVPVASPMQPLLQPQPMPLQQLQPKYVPEGRTLRPSISMPQVEPLAQAQTSRAMVHEASSAVQSSTSFASPAQPARPIVHQASSALQSSTSFASLAQPARPVVCQASSAVQSSTSFTSSAQPTRPVVHQASSAVQSSTSFASQVPEVSLLAQPQPVMSQLPQVVRPPTSQFAEPVATEPVATEPVATPRITPSQAFRTPQPVPLAPQASPQQSELEYDLVTVTRKGYEVRHFD